jgi:hypothetical protein
MRKRPCNGGVQRHLPLRLRQWPQRNLFLRRHLLILRGQLKRLKRLLLRLPKLKLKTPNGVV